MEDKVDTVREHFYVFDACDGCGKKKRVRRLPISSPEQGGAIIVCQACWSNEMAWRRTMNAKLDQLNSTLERWNVYGFYDPSPYGSKVEFDASGGEPLPDGEPAYTDQDYSAYPVKAGGYVIKNPDGDVIDFVPNLDELQDWMDSWEDVEAHMAELEVMQDAMASLDKTEVPLGRPKSMPSQDDIADLVGNPRVVFLWDRINGNTVIEEYVAYIIRRDLIRRHSDDQATLYDQSPNPVDLVHRAVQHATDTWAKIDFEWVVVVMPVGWEHNHRQNKGTTVEKSYAKFLAMMVLDANIREMREREVEP